MESLNPNFGALQMGNGGGVHNSFNNGGVH